MNERTLAKEGLLLDRLEAQPSDSLLALIQMANADTRPGKMDVGVGVFWVDGGILQKAFKVLPLPERSAETADLAAKVAPEI